MMVSPSAEHNAWDLFSVSTDLILLYSRDLPGNQNNRILQPAQ